MDELIKREDAIEAMAELQGIAQSKAELTGISKAWKRIKVLPTVDAVPVPDGGIGELSDGYHTFNGLYYQRMMLFAALVKTYKDRAWKSRRHSDGEPCFGGGWFIVGIDTPQGGFTYHYEDKYFDLFDCVELPNGKEWDGHTEDDVTRLLTLADWFCADGERRSDEDQHIYD